MKVTAPVQAQAVTRFGDWSAKPKEAADGQPQQEQAAVPVNRADLDKIVQKMNAAAQLFSKALQFKVLEGNRIIVKVIDTTNGEVLSEFPPEKLVEAFRSMEESLGLLVDKKV